MKKYFTKFSALLILIAIFFTASSFCFHRLFGSLITIQEAHAASTYDPEIKLDTCMGVSTIFQRYGGSVNSISHEKSLLPCCDSSSRPDVISSTSQMFEMTKVTSTLFFSGYEPIKSILISAIYYKNLTSPPELLALKSTVIRI
jgi:hypothetical protein